ncbi:putative tkp3 protein [Golovinomyces cichoracearum]|uniref:Putative tkp3 protein n=1 Tax=Golovinomyces cichoracearum TaxID=62708 RepID=A0A420IP35_9PEZI|nr:putative tkp3 protein [Golovinomyces cichoracearum]
MQRFADIFEHFDPKIVYRRGKTNTLADWLSRPMTKSLLTYPSLSYDPIKDAIHENSSQNKNTKSTVDPDCLHVLDIQLIGEHLSTNFELTSNLDKKWVHKHFAFHDEELFRVKNNLFFQVCHYDDMLDTLTKLHIKYGHCSIGVLLQYANRQFWHPHLILIAQETITICSHCQLMKKPINIHAQGTLRPIPTPERFSRWGMDHTGPVFHNGVKSELCTAVEYATSIGTAQLTQTPTAISALKLATHIYNPCGKMKKFIVNNGKAFTGKEFNDWLGEHEVVKKPIKPYRPQSNGKCEGFNSKKNFL